MKLTYFDVHGGRGEPIRLAMFLGKLDFHDNRFPFSDFAEVRQSTPLGQVPTLELKGETITQCNAITRYVGRLTNLYPSDPYQALKCDEIMEAIEDISYRLAATLAVPENQLKQAREQVLEVYIVPQLQWLQKKLDAAGDYFADNRLTVADLKVMVYLSWLGSGMLEHIPTSVVADHVPDLGHYYKRIKLMPEIMDYYHSVQE